MKHKCDLRQKKAEHQTKKGQKNVRQEQKNELRTEEESAGGEQVFQVVYQSPVKGH